MPWISAPMCVPCWNTQNPGREPITLNATVLESCHDCGRPTFDGIYVRRFTHEGVIT